MNGLRLLGCILFITLPFYGSSDTGSDTKSLPKDSLGFEYDTFMLDNNELRITFIGHATLILSYGEKTIHVDPTSMYADYSKLPKADLVLVTHSHSDHLDTGAIAKIAKSTTVVIASPEGAKQVAAAVALKNGETKTVAGFTIDAVPAYNTTSGREGLHPKGTGNGYVVTVAGKKIYIAGDTEPIEEMKNLANIFIAFLPMNQPYTMTPKQVADAAKTIKPQVLYPYHFGGSSTDELKSLLSKETSIEVRIRKLN
jgi:L-ascorbate metabolism protein UlaG (beta-lactamase superfamily)